MKRLIINRADGGISIMPVDEAHPIDVELSKWTDVASPEWLPIKGSRLVDDLPVTDRAFRNSLTDDGVNITYDMTKARDIWRDKLRIDRQPELEALDVQFMQALETGADTKTVVQEKQRLRDITADPRIEAAQTPEDLKKVLIDG